MILKTLEQTTKSCHKVRIVVSLSSNPMSSKRRLIIPISQRQWSYWSPVLLSTGLLFDTYDGNDHYNFPSFLVYCRLVSAAPPLYGIAEVGETTTET